MIQALKARRASRAIEETRVLRDHRELKARQGRKGPMDRRDR